jgi:3-hydroxyacyl-[acyl-carrier-protein] dehydratase
MAAGCGAAERHYQLSIIHYQLKGVSMPSPLHLNPDTIDLSRVLIDREGIRKINQQRFEMEQLDAIVLLDKENHIVVGYKDARPDEFWVRGHMPNFPLLPGVLMCEAAAQLLSYYVVTIGLLQGDFVAFGGLENVRFRGTVRPGDRLVLVGKGVRLDRRRTQFNVQGFVGTSMVFEGDIIGVPFKRQPGAEA